MWIFIENANYQYERKAEQSIEKKLSADSKLK